MRCSQLTIYGTKPDPGYGGTQLAWNNALEGVLSDTEEAFEQIWESLTTNQRRVLAAVAWIGPWGQGDSLFSHSTLSRFRLTKGTARDVQTSLLTSGELERVGEHKVRLVDPIFELWIASGRRVRS